MRKEKYYTQLQEEMKIHSAGRNYRFSDMYIHVNIIIPMRCACALSADWMEYWISATEWQRAVRGTQNVAFLGHHTTNSLTSVAW